jgi:hypothetical protein
MRLYKNLHLVREQADHNTNFAFACAQMQGTLGKHRELQLSHVEIHINTPQMSARCLGHTHLHMVEHFHSNFR